MPKVWGGSFTKWILPVVSCEESMRTRKTIESDGTRKDILALEVLLDIRDLLAKKEVKKRGRPQKTSSAKS